MNTEKVFLRMIHCPSVCHVILKYLSQQNILSYTNIFLDLFVEGTCFRSWLLLLVFY